jgi:ABC-type antimicrobial peptide transport system permease subunit
MIGCPSRPYSLFSGASLTGLVLFAGYLVSLRAARLNPLDALHQR